MVRLRRQTGYRCGILTDLRWIHERTSSLRREALQRGAASPCTRRVQGGCNHVGDPVRIAYHLVVAQELCYRRPLVVSKQREMVRRGELVEHELQTGLAELFDRPRLAGLHRGIVV